MNKQTLLNLKSRRIIMKKLTNKDMQQVKGGLDKGTCKKTGNNTACMSTDGKTYCSYSAYGGRWCVTN